MASRAGLCISPMSLAERSAFSVFASVFPLPLALRLASIHSCSWGISCCVQFPGSSHLCFLLGTLVWISLEVIISLSELRLCSEAGFSSLTLPSVAEFTVCYRCHPNCTRKVMLNRVTGRSFFPPLPSLSFLSPLV